MAGEWNNDPDYARRAMSNRFVLLLFPCVVVACGTATAPASGPERAPSAPASAADECLAQASAPRTSREDAPSRVGVAHVLVRHKDLKRAEGATRSRAEACLRAQEAREKLLAGADFAAVVAEYSDGGGATGGKLGSVSRSELDATFADAAFALDVGELSHVVETPRGFHVIARSE